MLSHSSFSWAMFEDMFGPKKWLWSSFPLWSDMALFSRILIKDRSHERQLFSIEQSFSWKLRNIFHQKISRQETPNSDRLTIGLMISRFNVVILPCSVTQYDTVKYSHVHFHGCWVLAACPTQQVNLATIGHEETTWKWTNMHFYSCIPLLEKDGEGVNCHNWHQVLTCSKQVCIRVLKGGLAEKRQTAPVP